MRINIDITPEAWEVLKPVLQPMMVNDNYHPKESLNFGEIANLDNGIRIYNILKDNMWECDYRNSDCIETTDDLLSITKREFVRHRNAGSKSWKSLNAYMEVLRQRQNNQKT